MFSFIIRYMKNKTITYSKISLEIYNNNLIMFKLNKQNINWFYSLAKTKTKTIDKTYIVHVSGNG